MENTTGIKAISSQYSSFIDKNHTKGGFAQSSLRALKIDFHTDAIFTNMHKFYSHEAWSKKIFYVIAEFSGSEFKIVILSVKGRIVNIISGIFLM